MSEDGRSPRPPAAPSPGPAGMSVGPWIGRALAALAQASTRRPLVTVLISLLLAAAGMAYTAPRHHVRHVEPATPAAAELYVVRLKEYQRDFGELNDIVVVVEAPSPDRSKAYAARLVAELGAAGGRARRGSPTGSIRAYFEGAACSISPVTTSPSCAIGSSTIRSSSRATRPARRCPSSSPGSTSRSPTRWPSGSSISGCGPRDGGRTCGSSSR